jgi:hypothetical protein
LTEKVLPFSPPSPSSRVLAPFRESARASDRQVIRYEHKAENFLAFLELACAIILLKRF